MDINFVKYENDQTLYMRAPNKFRKILINKDIPKSERDEWGMDYSLHSPECPKQLECIEMQIKEFPDISDKRKPIGFQPLMDNDLSIAWE